MALSLTRLVWQVREEITGRFREAGVMHTWPVQDAKARFSELLDACLVAVPQMISRDGADVAVLVPVQEWQRLQSAERPSLKQLLLSGQARMP